MIWNYFKNPIYVEGDFNLRNKYNIKQIFEYLNGYIQDWMGYFFRVKATEIVVNEIAVLGLFWKINAAVKGVLSSSSIRIVCTRHVDWKQLGIED